MHKSILSGFKLGLLVLMSAVLLRAAEETADSILTRSAEAYATSERFSARAYQREVWVRTGQTPDPQLGQPAVYNVVTLRMQKPNDWYVSSLMMREIPASPGRSPGFANQIGYVLAKSGPTMGKLGSFGFSNRPSSPPGNLTDDEFEQAIRTRLVDSPQGFVAFAPFFNERNPMGSFGMSEANLIGEETWAQHAVYRIEGHGATGRRTILWIDKESSLILRTLMEKMVAPQRVLMVESIYEPTINPRFYGNDFDFQEPALNTQWTVAQMGFGDVVELAGYASKGDGNGAGLPGQGPAGTPASAPISAVAEQQALSADQMSGIVLIDGDEGTATGFMTKIRGVDFVVTNEHVLGSNKKIMLKNLRGEVIPVLAVYGAVGSDVAILRIGKAEGGLKISEDVLKSVKIGDKVVVVGNRLGGGVATQTSGQVLGLGPTRIEVNANFEPGNSGSPIFSTVSNEVVGVATYAETRKISVDEGASSSRYNASPSGTTKVDKRWFGYRLDGLAHWEAIDMKRWHAQGERIDKFRDMSEALVAVIKFDFKTAAENEKLAPVIADFESRAEQMKRDRAGVAVAVKDLMRTIRSMAEAGINDFSAGDFYDYYRTCLYWEESVPMQVEYRQAILEVLKKYETNSNSYISRMRNGGG